MRELRIFGAAALTLVMLASDASARGGSGVRGAVVGGMVGGSEGAAKGAKVGVVTGATRAAIGQESHGRSQYVATEEYQNAQHSNFNEATPEVLGTTAAGAATKASGEAVIRKDNKPIVGVTFPSDWNQRTGANYVSAVSPDGQAYSMFVVDKVADKEAGVKRLKQGLEKYLTDIKYDEPSKAKDGGMVITGTGKAKKAGADVVFATGLFDAGSGQLLGASFIVDSKMDDHYKETIRGVCETIRFAKDFSEQPREVAKPIIK